MPLDPSIALNARGVGPLMSPMELYGGIQQAQMQREQARAMAEQRQAIAEQRQQQTAKIAQENTSRANTGQAIQKGGGVRAKTLEWAMANDPTIVPGLTEYFDKADDRSSAILKARHELQAQESELFADLADGAIKHGATPEALRTALDYAVERFPEYQEHAATIWTKAQAADETGRKALLEQIRDLAPSRRPKAAEPFSLNPGETRFDGSGRQIAAVAPKVDAPKAGTLEDYLASYATAKGRTLAQLSPYDKRQAKSEWESAGRAPASPEPLVAIMGTDGQSVLVPRSQAVGKRPASNREQGRPVTSGDAGTIAEFTSALDDIGALRSTLEGAGATGTASRAAALLPNVVTDFTGWGTQAKTRQATIDRVKQVIGKALEGGVLRKEDEYKYEKILPTIGDTSEVAASKMNGLESAIKKKQQRHLDALGDAGYDTSKFTERGATAAPVSAPPVSVPPQVDATLKGQKDGHYTLTDGSKWTIKGGVVRKDQ